MNEGISVLLKKKESILKQLLEVSREINETIARSAAPEKITELISRKEKFFSQLQEVDAGIISAGAGQSSETPDKTLININSLLNDLIKTEKENDSTISAMMEHRAGGHIKEYEKLNKNRGL